MYILAQVTWIDNLKYKVIKTELPQEEQCLC